MAAKKTATKTAKKTTEAAPAKAAAPVAKKAAKKAAPAKPATKAAKQAAPPITTDLIARTAYLNYRRRIEQGLPGDSRSDWLEAERQLSKS